MSSSVSPSPRTLLARLPSPPAGRHGWPWTEEVSSEIYRSRAQWPRIAVVTPSFNQVAYVEETIRSVLLQNYPALDYFVIDGGSTDGSAQVIARYAPWLAGWCSESDRGQSHALNKGFDRALPRSPDWLGWINSDDYYLPGAFAEVGKIAARTHGPALLYGHHRFLDQARAIDAFHYERRVFGWEISCGARQLPSHATFWSARRHLPIDESYQFIMDADLFIRLARAGLTPRRVDAPLAVFRAHANAKTARLQQLARAETALRLTHAPAADAWRWVASRRLTQLTRLCDRLLSRKR